MFKRAKVGDTVKILHSVFSDVSVGETGEVECLATDPSTHEKGYGVKFTKFWSCTFINEKPPFDTRVLWFPLDAVKVLTPDQVAALQEKEKEKEKK